MVVVVPTLPARFSDPGRISGNSTQFWHYLLKHGIIAHKLRSQFYQTSSPNPSSNSNYTPRFFCYLYFWLIEVPMTPFLVFINLLQWLTKVREIFYLLDYHFILKWYNSVIDRWKIFIAKVRGKGIEISCPLHVCHSSNLHTFTSMEALWMQSFWIFIEFHYIGMIN